MDRDTPQEHIASSERNFCKKCSTMLWLYDETWCVSNTAFLCLNLTHTAHFRPELLHPFASAIDSPELDSPESLVNSAPFPPPRRLAHGVLIQVVVKANSKPAYVRLPEGKKEVYEDYGPDSIEEWHKKHKLYTP